MSSIVCFLFKVILNEVCFLKQRHTCRRKGFSKSESISIGKMLPKILYFVSLLTISTWTTCTSCTCDDDISRIPPERNEDFNFEVLQKGRTRRMIWLDKKRRLTLPQDTSISVTPILAFPMFKQSSTWVSFQNIQIEWTFFILFQGLGWTSDENAWPLDISFLFPNMSTPETTPRRRTDNTNCYKNYRSTAKNNCGPKIPIMALPTSTPGGERATLIPLIEKFINSVGINGRACLQRAVCEVHEIPLKNGFGLLGEFLTLLFSISESSYARSHLPGYLSAEKAGKYGDCSHFNRKCPYSIFTGK